MRSVRSRLFLLAPLLLAGWLVACEPAPAQTTAEPTTPEQTSRGQRGREAPASSVPTARDPVSGLPWITRAALPPEGRQVLARIAQGGPFPYRKDGAAFGNRERLLPRQPGGHYREYTVPTPGETDRGARRIVCGGVPVTRTAECYYTADHYASFRRIAP
ncbi:ribonuclease domain-containing protein [Deinococcus aquaedulcis]|uniref:ribonuclease domain-containing protein n=1 Tax=Deinococcus aquaedulcis TaxID=2840455 RepID=UPI001C839C28|nr:ribonuclease domain-containing protein [Deinococcus aquaedulcis]